MLRVIEISNSTVTSFELTSIQNSLNNSLFKDLLNNIIFIVHNIKSVYYVFIKSVISFEDNVSNLVFIQILLTPKNFHF